jgi:hypothetical protein
MNYSDILRDLEGLDEWLLSLGVPVRSADRVHYAIRKLESAEQAFLSGTPQARGVSKSDYLFGLTEALELRDVYRAFRDHPPQHLRDRLTRALSGPHLPEAETTRNRDGRNIMFELALGAEWALNGASVDLIEPDLGLKMAERYYLVACKRPESEHGIRAAVRDAASQLRSALACAPMNHFGVIAISLSRVLNPGNTYFSGNYEQLSELLNGLMSLHRPNWRATDFHPQNIAISFYAQTPADWGEGLYRLSAMRTVEARGDYTDVHRNFESDLRELYGVPA